LARCVETVTSARFWSADPKFDFRHVFTCAEDERISGRLSEIVSGPDQAEYCQLLQTLVQSVTNDQHVQVGVLSHDPVKQESVLGKSTHEE
jgi:hypothetical protein